MPGISNRLGRLGIVFERVHCIEVYGRVSERDISRLGALSYIEELGLYSDDITDDSMRSLSRLRRLKQLSLRASSDGSGLVHLNSLRYLQGIVFFGKSIKEIGSLRSAGPLSTMFVFPATDKESIVRLIKNNPNLKVVNFIGVGATDCMSCGDYVELKKEFPAVAFFDPIDLPPHN